MSRTLKIAKDGSIYEFQEEQIIQVTETQGQIQLLIQTLQFTSAETFEVIPDEDIGSRGAVEPRSATRKINEEGIKLIKSFEGLHDLKQNNINENILSDEIQNELKKEFQIYRRGYYIISFI